MNLAQMLDAEWVSAGCPEPFPRVRTGGGEPPSLRIVDHVDKPQASIPPGQRTGARRRILELLNLATKPLTARQIARLDDSLTVGQVAANLSGLHGRKCVERNGVHGSYAYAITYRGRVDLERGANAGN